MRSINVLEMDNGIPSELSSSHIYEEQLSSDVCEGMDLEAESFNLAQMPNRITNGNTMLASGWHSVEDRPLFTKDDLGNWTCTEDGHGEFIAALPFKHSRRPNEQMWWIRHCVIEGDIGLCVVGDDDNEPAAWHLEDVTHWMPMPSPPVCS